MDLGILVQNSGPDLAMLFLAMKLVITSADEVGDDSLYSLAKNFLATLEHHGVISLLCLQAMVLVALYENSHAIYPAAWMTIGACARYADMLGLSCGGKDMPWIGQAVRSATLSLLCSQRDQIWRKRSKLVLDVRIRAFHPRLHLHMADVEAFQFTKKNPVCGRQTHTK